METSQQPQFKEDWEIQWEKCKPLIEKAVKYQDAYTIEYIEDKIKNGTALLWPGKESAFITEVVVYPNYHVLNILCFSGNYDEFEKMYPTIENFAKEIKAKKLIAGGRKGWLRKIKHLGWKQDNYISKEIGV
tara:strand:- start:4891 stop:5286 length:396 start_codon:yes stop_codon:yes gene_type:complete